MYSFASSRLRIMYRAPLIAASFATTLGCLWQFCETYLHYQHTYSQQLKHAINVLDSDLCREHHDGASIGSSKAHATYVDCEGAQEVKDGLRPSYRALGNALADWSLCGQHRCEYAASVLESYLASVAAHAYFFFIILVLILLNCLYHSWSYSDARSRNMHALDTGMTSDHYCLLASGRQPILREDVKIRPPKRNVHFLNNTPRQSLQL